MDTATVCREKMGAEKLRQEAVLIGSQDWVSGVVVGQPAEISLQGHKIIGQPRFDGQADEMWQGHLRFHCPVPAALLLMPPVGSSPMYLT